MIVNYKEHIMFKNLLLPKKIMATVIAFTSGKGGVGKTNISTNLGLSLVARNLKVCLFDADTGLANINILMGINPRYTIEHVLNGQKSIDEIIITHPSGISVVPAASGIKQCTNLNDEQIAILTSSLQTLENKFDYILVDTAAGIDTNVLDFVASAQYRIIVITSEPTSLTDSFALLKMLMIRGKKKSIFILVNRVEDYRTSQIVFKRFQKAVKTYLKIDVHYLGYLTTDPYVNKAVSEQTPVVLSYPNSSISCGLASLADIIKRQFRNDKNLPYFSQFWSLNAQNNKAESSPQIVTIDKADQLAPSKKPVAIQHDKLANIYSLLEQEQLSETQLKELTLNLETIYEKKHKTPLRNINSLVAVILAEGNAEKIQQLHQSIANSYQRQFSEKIDNPISILTDLINSDQFSKDNFNQLMDKFEDVYQQRFKEKYFSEGNKLLTKIQQLLSSK